MKIAVTGATGYIGGRLVPQLLEAGHEVVCLARTPNKLNDRPWRDDVEVRQCDVLVPGDIDAALDGCEAAYYLIHSMGSASDFSSADHDAASNFAAAAETNGLRRIVYLGGLGSGDSLSSHLASRQEVGEVLASGSTPVTEMRAAVVIGSGSVSFEMLRYLTEVLPVMTTPRWVETKCQPIAIRDVLAYLVEAVGDDDGSHIYEIGGPEVVTYREMMQAYARAAGLRRRLIIGVPVLSPRLSSLWIGLVTPIPVGVARPLVDSLRNEVTVGDSLAPTRFSVDPIPLSRAIELALDRDDRLDVPSRWSDASSSPASPFAWDPDWAGGTLLLDQQTVETDVDSDDLYWAFSRIGGSTGYYTYNWAWRLRGVLDTLFGGVGLRRGRRHPEMVWLHDTIDFWRVAAVEPGKHLQLSAEMKLPGDAWLEWNVVEGDEGRTLEQNAYFRPRGLAGRLYWYAMLPFHTLIFGRMARKIVEAARTRPRQLISG
ncbi:MAG: SDR family oxidoreductase [Acidimicrobiia bacterium]|nr:SDR family oxidoreductase [Acidimicrobiia bacterium]